METVLNVNVDDTSKYEGTLLSSASIDDFTTKIAGSWDKGAGCLIDALKEEFPSAVQVSKCDITIRELDLRADIEMCNVMFEALVVGDPSEVAKLEGVLNSNPKVRKLSSREYETHFTHIYNTPTGLETDTQTFTTTSKHLAEVYGELYPRLDTEMLIDIYAKSDESLLILTGTPGVGKTCFAKMLCKTAAQTLERSIRIGYVKDPAVLRMDSFWATLHRYGFDFLLLDDLDDELKPRTEGKNPIVNNILSFSDGMFPPKTKIIVTTNQPNSDIDKAVIRPGRCFDILSLPPLSYEEALSIWVDPLGRDNESFIERFGEDESISITQASLMSEHKRMMVAERPDYLIDTSISIRSLVEVGEAANSE